MTTKTRSRQDAPDPAAVEALVRGDHGDPFALLGMHEAPGGRLVVRTLQPHAGRVWLNEAATGRSAGEMSRRHADGLFVADLPDRKERFPYRLRLEMGQATSEAGDPYSFPPILGELDVYLMAEGNHLSLYEKLGAH